MTIQRRCRCNGCLMLAETVSPDVISYWCPHLDSPERPDIRRHLAWQKLNNVPDWLCKYRLIPRPHDV
jgi:hypothetical protein